MHINQFCCCFPVMKSCMFYFLTCYFSCYVYSVFIYWRVPLFCKLCLLPANDYPNPYSSAQCDVSIPYYPPTGQDPHIPFFQHSRKQIVEINGFYLVVEFLKKKKKKLLPAVGGRSVPFKFCERVIRLQICSIINKIGKIQHTVQQVMPFIQLPVWKAKWYKQVKCIHCLKT